MLFRFGDFEADRAAYRVTRRGTAVDLTPKLLDLLFHLLDHPGQLVTKEDLLDAVWPGANVTENAMAQAVSDLREALGDDAAAPTYIKTISRRGYRFIAPVDPLDRSRAAVQTSPPAPSDKSGARTLAVTDFVNLTGDADVAWLGAGIAETVASDLATLGEFRVVDRWRVAEAARTAGGSASVIGAASGASLVVIGSFQRRGPQLRITARLVDVARGDAVADVKVDGRLEDVFSLQDQVVRAFAHELGLTLPPSTARIGVGETSNLAAYRAYMEGWLKVESMDVTQNTSAMADFQRAIELDPKYAIAYSGLANAEFIAYDNTRATPSPNFAALRSGIEHARYGVQLGPDLAEAHATLSFLLTCAYQFDEARKAAQRAVMLEPDSWRHQYRLGHALWGEARLRAFDRALALYPQFAYARLEMAMVHVARGRLDTAVEIARRGAGEQDRQRHDRFPAVGFHWLLGALLAARGDLASAVPSFDRELAQADASRLYRTEYAAAALVSRGHALMQQGEVEEAADSFRQALTWIDHHPRALLGVALADRRLGKAGSDQRFREAHATITNLRRPEREAEWHYATACEAAVDEDAAAAADSLGRLLDSVPMSYVAWTIPIESAFLGITGAPAFKAVLDRLAERAA